MSGLLSFVLFLVACHATYGEVTPRAEDYRLPNDVKVNNYELLMEPDLNNFSFTGEVKIAITPQKDVATLTLNAKNLKVEKKDVSLKQGTTTISVSNVVLNEEFEFLVIALSGEITAKKDYTLIIKFSGVLNDQKTGFYRSRLFDKDNNVKYIAATHFEPTGARWAFPCWDEPAYKAPFTIKIKHEEKYTAFSNMGLEGEPVKDGDKLVSTFKKSPPISTYLVAFVVAEYECVVSEDKFFRVCTKPHAKEHGNYALKMGQDLLNALNTYTAYNYSTHINKMDQLTIRDFSPSAMENWGLVTYRETSLLYEEGVTSNRVKQSITTVIAHEFAHQWFGNLVSPKWWMYVWLNEGFANYMQYFITNDLIPAWRLNETFVTENLQGNAFVADAVLNARPMDKEVQSPSEISRLFDSIGYQKAGSVIRMMSHILGESVFQSGLQKYLKKNELNVADSDNLLTVLEEELGKEIEGAKFKDVMKTWITQAGYPVVNVKHEKDGEFQVSQERFLDGGSTDSTKWWVPLTYTSKSELEFRNTTPVKWLKPDQESVSIAIKEKDDWILVNKLQTGYYRVNYDKENWEKLDSYLKSKDYEKIPAINRAQLIDDALNLARAHRLSYSEALSLTNYLNKEHDYVPWSAAFRNVNFLHNMMRHSKHYNVFKKYVTFITKQLVKDVGFEAKKDESEIQKILRVSLTKWACKVGVQTCTNYAKGKFESWLNDSTVSLDVDLKNTILCAGLRDADLDNWKKAFNNLVASTKDEDEKKSLLTNIPVCSNSVDILKTYLNLTLEKDAPVSFDAVVQGIVAEHQNGVNVTLDVLLNQFDQINQLPNAKDVIKMSTQAISGGIANKEEYTQLSFFMVKQGSEAKDLQDATQKALKNLEWLEENEAAIEKWLTSNEDLFNSAASLAFTSLLVVLSIFITRFY